MYELPSLLLLFGMFLPLLYYLYLSVIDPWSELKKRRKLHGFGGDKWIETEQGAMAIDDDKWVIYLYKIDE